MDDWARKQRRLLEIAICEKRGISREQLWALYAAFRCWKDSACADSDSLRTILLLGYDINSERGNEGETLLMLAARRGQVNALSLLTAHGADVNLQDMYGYTALMWAAVSGSAECARVLLEYGADPSIESEPSVCDQHTALSLADSFRHPDVRAEIERFLAQR
jgi:ankyrin repeat protein